MHIAEMMFISKILLCQDPLSGGDQLQELPLAPHLQMGVEEVDIKSPPLLSPAKFHYHLFFSAGKLKMGWDRLPSTAAYLYLRYVAICCKTENGEKS